MNPEVAEALNMLASVRVFVTSRERIKHPEGDHLFNAGIDTIRAHITQLTAEAEALRRDAERYRWLRGDPTERDLMTHEWPWAVFVDRRSGAPTMCPIWAANLDAAIDAARQQEAPNEG